jgi:hypothetical protein
MSASPGQLFQLLLDVLVETCTVTGTNLIQTKNNPSLERAAQCLVGAKLLRYEGADKYTEIEETK